MSNEIRNPNDQNNVLNLERANTQIRPYDMGIGINVGADLCICPYMF